MMKKYESPEMISVALSANDVITLSKSDYDNTVSAPADWFSNDFQF